MVVSIGTIMFMVEHGKNGDNFNSIPNSIYWATVTMTTVGYGDIAPVTTLGRFLAGVVMLIGYTVLAVLQGILTVSMVNMERKRKSMSCPHCGKPIDKRIPNFANIVATMWKKWKIWRLRLKPTFRFYSSIFMYGSNSGSFSLAHSMNSSI